MDQAHNFYLNCYQMVVQVYFVFKLQHKAACWLISFPYMETSSLQKIIALQNVESLIWRGGGVVMPPILIMVNRFNLCDL